MNIIYRSKAPLRLGLAGGGTDLDVYCDKHKGFVLNATISLYAHCSIEETFDNKIFFESLDMEQYLEIDSQKQIPLNGEMDLYIGVYNRIVKDYIHRPLSFKLYAYSDVPSGSGLGGSSTMVVAIIKAFAEWLNLPLGEYDIAKLAVEIERNDLNMVGGTQDQYAAAFGGFNFMEFSKGQQVVVNPLGIEKWVQNEFEELILLYFTGVERNSEQIEEEKSSLVNSEKSLNAMHKVKKNALLMKESLLKGDTRRFSKILSDSWKAKKDTSPMISNYKLNCIYKLARENGAYSGKVSGAGGGGFIFFIVDPRKKLQLKKLLNKQEGAVFEFEFVNSGVHSWRVTW